MTTNDYSHRPLRRHRQRGFSLLVIAAAAVILIGMLGLAFDVGRMFIIKNELQTFADSAALAAVRSLDSTKTGVDLAHTTALNGPLGTSVPNGVNFDTKKVTAVTDTYASTFNGTYKSYADATGTATNTFRFVKVVANASLPLYFLGAVKGDPRSTSLNAISIAGQAELPGEFTNGGLVPFSPAAHDAADKKYFGLVPGQTYTLKWGQQSASTDCAGDLGWIKANSFPAQRGYVDLGQGNGASNLRKAIEFGGYPDGIHIPKTIDAGDTLGGVPGNKSPSLTAIMNRSSQDPDQTSLTWEAYKASLQAGTANGRRLVTTIIDDPDQATKGGNGTYEAIGFGTFLLEPAAVYDTADQSGHGSYCAIYLGPASLSGGATAGTNGTAMYKVMLFR